ncbi:efflux RND transporter permease subunit [Paludisphaera borealis]|uniref:Cation efflux system protein CusA n=1 Tax=Paludisphaera borealis TaxID=1387353 RepID=A0A1U7CTI5_9BACT|nr:efflux RND transporter permease subunit [Paludisphaera borealis]APW62193.1 Cation efflux system protein CusA [Paludisphaera borealis]
MIDAIIRFSIRRRWLVIASALVMAALGVWAVRETPVDAIPDLSENQILVFTEWKGHSPREIEDQVTYPLVLELNGIRGVRVVRSSSEVGFALVSVIFHDATPLDEARRLVGERLARAQGRLPQNVRPELTPDALATGQIFWYTVEGGGLDLGRLRAVQDWYVRPQLGSVPGVAEVSSVGGFPTEYQIAVDPGLLKARGVLLKDVLDSVAASNSSAGGHVVEQGNAETVVQGVGWLGASPRLGDAGFDRDRAVRDLEEVVVPTIAGGVVRLAELANVAIGPGSRRGVLEKDGDEVVGGVVLMAAGENPLEVTRRIQAKLGEVRAGLPPGVRVRPFYDRTPLIEGAIATVSTTVVEAMVSATICVLIVLLHFRTSLVIAVTLPLAALGSFLIMAVLRRVGVLDVQANAMSLAGIAISIGVLVDSSIVMAENVMHRLHDHFGDRPVRGDVAHIVLPACLAVGRPIIFSVVIMLLSFLPVLALGGVEGKMFRPLAYTKSFALVTVAVLSITLVPALCTILVRGRLRSEQDNPLVRSVIEVYRPVLSYLLDRPQVMAWVISCTFLIGLAPLGNRVVFLGALGLAVTATALLARSAWGLTLAPASLVIIALLAEQNMQPLGREFITPLDEGMVMDMPITVPRATVSEVVDDLKARDMILCRFPEVDMVVGKGGRAETPTDPAPIDMIETMVNFRPRAFWPRRKLREADARSQLAAALDALVAREVLAAPEARQAMLDEALEESIARFDVVIRETAYQRYQELVRESSGVSPTSLNPSDPEEARLVPRWRAHVRRVDGELLDRAAPVFTRIAVDELLNRGEIRDPRVAAHHAKAKAFQNEAIAALLRPPGPGGSGGEGHHHGGRPASAIAFEPQPLLDEIRDELSRRFARGVMLWQIERDELVGFGGELDRAVPMPGWTNVWTMPIQNRVDMLATGVNTPIGVRVLGDDLDDVVRTSEAIAAVVKTIPGAVDVVADPIRGKSYLEIRFDRRKAAQLGVSIGEANKVIETALAGTTATTTVEGRERHPVVVRYARARREDDEAIRRLLVPARGGPADGPRVRQVPLSDFAEVGLVEGPASIKGENGLLRNYVRLNATDQDPVAFVARAREVVSAHVPLPAGVFVEWTGQFEHEVRSRRTLAVVVPLVIVLIFVVLYLTYLDLADAALMLTAIPGAAAGGLFFQWLLGLKLSVTVWIGYIACFGMATSTGIIMLVYLREAVERAGGLERLDLDGLRKAVIDGAVHRLRPKLLTEGTVVIGLAPMLWASGPASEIIRPMAAPVLGGVLVADEVIDLLLPVLFYWVRRRRWERLQRRRSVNADALTT